MSKAQKRVLNVIRRLFIPIARLLIHFNVDCRQSIEMLKSAFVEVARSDYGIRERKTNISRVALLTGLTRKEVRRLVDRIERDATADEIEETPLQRLLSAWSREAKTASGKPANIDFDGTEKSIEGLKHHISVDLPAGAIRYELLRVGAIKETKSGKFRMERGRLLTDRKAEELCQTIRMIEAAALNVARNVIEERKEAWPNVCVESRQIRTKDVETLRMASMRKVKEFGEQLTGIYRGYDELYPATKNEATVSSGVVVFHYEK